MLLNKFGDWTFPTLAGIITTPTLRPDGTHPEGCGLRSGHAIAADRSAANAGDTGEADAGRCAGRA